MNSTADQDYYRQRASAELEAAEKADAACKFAHLELARRYAALAQPPPTIDVLGLIADSVVCTDEEGRIMVFNRAAAKAFGYRPDEVLGHRVEILLPERDREYHQREVANFASGRGSAARLMGRRRSVRGRHKDGREIPLEATVSRQVVEGRTILTAVLRDVAERKASEELRETVMHELDHRLRNMLSVISALISLSAAHATDVHEFAEELRGRLIALAATQRALDLNDQTSMALDAIFQAEVEQYRAPDGANVTIDCLPISVGPRVAQILSLAIHELATNSAKYGALHTAGGHVALTSAYQGEKDDKLLIQWKETGGPLVNSPDAKGFGTDLVQRLVGRSLRADVEIDYRPEGLICRMTLPKEVVTADC